MSESEIVVKQEPGLDPFDITQQDYCPGYPQSQVKEEIDVGPTVIQKAHPV